MSLGGVDMGVVSRSQDYTIIKQNEDTKPFLDQSNISHQVDKQVEQLTEEVHDSNDAEWYDKKNDAGEKGSNEYYGDGGRNRKKKSKTQQSKTQQRVEQVVIKGRENFDIKI